jgi:hypothetical protein
VRNALAYFCHRQDEFNGVGGKVCKKDEREVEMDNFWDKKEHFFKVRKLALRHSA